MSKKIPAELEHLARDKANEYSQEEDFNAGFYDGYRDCATLLVEAQERVKDLTKQHNILCDQRDVAIRNTVALEGRVEELESKLKHVKDFLIHELDTKDIIEFIKKALTPKTKKDE